MLPTFLSKCRATRSLHVGIALGILLLLTLVYSLCISVVLAHRTFSRTNKVALIAFLLGTALAALGMLERIRR